MQHPCRLLQLHHGQQIPSQPSPSSGDGIVRGTLKIFFIFASHSSSPHHFTWFAGPPVQRGMFVRHFLALHCTNGDDTQNFAKPNNDVYETEKQGNQNVTARTRGYRTVHKWNITSLNREMRIKVKWNSGDKVNRNRKILIFTEPKSSLPRIAT